MQLLSRSGEKSSKLVEFPHWKLARKSDLSRVSVSRTSTALVGNLQAHFSRLVRAKIVHPCNNRGSYARAFETRLQRCETASVARIRAQTIISLINPVGLARQTDNSVQC